MESMFERNKDFYSEEEQTKLRNSVVLQFGVGGIGCITSEILVRSGVGTIILVDKDTFSISNLNRQIGATQETIGLSKVEVMAKRLKSINPNVSIIKVNEFLDESWKNIIPTTDIDIHSVDIVIDATGGVENKILVSDYAKKYNRKLVSGRVYKYNYWIAILHGKTVDDFATNRQGLTPIVTQGVLFMCAGMMSKFICGILLNRIKGYNYLYRYKNNTLELSRTKI